MRVRRLGSPQHKFSVFGPGREPVLRLDGARAGFPALDLKKYRRSREDAVGQVRHRWGGHEIDLDTVSSFSKCLPSHFHLSVSTKVCQIVELKGLILTLQCVRRGIATGVLVGRFNLSANASWLLNRAAISETIQEPLRKPTTPKRRSPPTGGVRRKSLS